MMTVLLNATLFKVGERVVFLYHDKQREGTVERVNHSNITLRDMVDEKEPYKSFRYDKIQRIAWLIVN